MKTVTRRTVLRRGRSGFTDYSREVPGAKGNYDWPVQFDMTNGNVGITQSEGGKVKDRVLLSPAQVSELLRFVAPKQKEG